MFCVHVCLFVVALDAVFAAVAIQPPVEKPEKYANEEGCYNPDIDKVIPYNQTYSPQDGTTCRQYTCRSDNFTSIFTCGAIVIPEGCERDPGDLYLTYPKCCDTFTCPDKDVNVDVNNEITADAVNETK